MEAAAAGGPSPDGESPGRPPAGWTGDTLHDDDDDGEGGNGGPGERSDVNAHPDPGRRRTEQWLTRVGSAPREFLTPDQPRVRRRGGFG